MLGMIIYKATDVSKEKITHFHTGLHPSIFSEYLGMPLNVHQLEIAEKYLFFMKYRNHWKQCLLVTLAECLMPDRYGRG